MKPGQLSQQLSAGNPWWRMPVGWEAQDVQLRAAASSGIEYAPEVLGSVPRGSLVLLRGPRRVGKSVELKRLVGRAIAAGAPPRSVIHAAVDGWRDGDLRSLVEIGKRLTPAGTTHRWWLIDEVSGVPGWESVIKNLRDNDPEFSMDTVVLTGSSARDLTRATSALAGRRGPVERPDRTLLPMGFRTFAQLMMRAHNESVPSADRIEPSELRTEIARRTFDELAPWATHLAAWWEIYLQVGGFPQAVAAHASGADAGHVAQALFDVVHRDVFGAADLSEPQISGLLARIGVSLASPLNVASLGREVGTSQDSATRRLEDLTAAYLVWPCFSSRDLRPNLRAQSKRYFVDPLVARLTPLRNQAHADIDPTKLTEQQIGVALLRAAERSSPGTLAGFDQVLHERTASRSEIDFVGPTLGEVAIEAKYTDAGTWRRESATVNASRFAGIMATRSVLDLSATSPGEAWAVPAGMLAFSLDT